MKHPPLPTASLQELGFYSIGLWPVTARALERFLLANAVPSLDLRAGRRGFALLERPVTESRALLRRLHAVAPLRMIASDVDLGDVVADRCHERAWDSITALDALICDVPDCLIRLLGRYVPRPEEFVGLRELTALWPAHTLLLELHDPTWFHPAIAAPWTLCADWPSLRLLADSDQIAQAISCHGSVPVAASLAAMRDHVGMVHLCDTGDGLDRDATDMIAQTLFGRNGHNTAVPVGFEFTGPDRSAACVAQAYARACAHWQSSLGALQLA
ncbi:hypothetical protein [Pseudoruegeria sp. HB172150]|uniref:hypothetical protein n=1 Tax=Pseudoruegeria sp. HB172150 TaxID=2721164 RepID=UPI00155215E3|nr:hypothetical protein [Pseudoruegeria sp. HB172150]